MNDTRCHFCGYEYDEAELLDKCGRCPLKVYHSVTGVSCCPNCGIEVRMRSGILDFVERLNARLRTAKNRKGG